MDDDDATDGASESRKKNGRGRDAEATRMYCELLRQPIWWAAKRGSEGWTLCKIRIIRSGQWGQFLLLRAKMREAYPELSKERLRTQVIRDHFGYEGLLEERHLFYVFEGMRGPWMPQERPDGPDVIAMARNNSLGRPTNIELEEFHDATAAEQAYGELPNEAPNEKIVAWVMAHRRVFLLRQNPPAEDQVPDTTLSAQDIAGAPCKQAVTMLQEALANVKEFWKAMLSEQKKSTGKAAEGGLDDMSEAGDEEMLRIING
jgi:hypothetical protein